MNNTRSLFTALTFGLLLGWAIPRSLALTATEPPDFANDAGSAATYVLDVGGNDFVGEIDNPGGNLDADYFKVTVLPGRVVTGIQRTGAAPNTLTPPLYAGTYTLAITPQVLPGSQLLWGFTFTVAAAPDYEVSTTGGQMVVTDRSGFGDTLTVSEPFAGAIRFAAPGRTFSLNGAAFTMGDSGDIAHGLSSSITVNAGAGSDTINVGAFGSPLPGLTINGGTGDDTVNFNGNLWIAVDQNLDVDLQNDDASPGVDSVNVAVGANLTTSGFGSITVRCSRSVSLASGASLATAYGPLTVEANQQEPATPGNFVGVNLSGATLSSAGTNLGATPLTVKGRGGNDAGGYQLGVNLDSGAIITGGEHVNVDVIGTGGASTGGVNRGVTLNGSGAVIESTSEIAGSVNVTGTGGPASNHFGIGVSLLGGSIRAAATGFATATVTVTGTGAGAPGTSVNQGVELGGGNILADSGDLVVRGTAGPGASVGMYMDGSQGIFMNSGGGNITLRADSLSFLGTARIGTANPVSKVTIGQRNAFSGPIDLGGADPAVGKLSLTDAILDRITTANLVVGVDSTTAIGTSAEVSPANVSSALTLYSGGVQPTFTGTDVTLPATRTLRVAGPLVIPITGANANTAPGYPQLKVAGQVDLSTTSLALTGTTFAGSVGDTFTLIDNDGTDAIVGTFGGLPENASAVWPGATPLNARISYVGGDGNDAVLTLFSPLTVTNTAGSGPGSLPFAVVYALQEPGAHTIDFAPWLSGQTIVFTGQLVLDDTDGVTIDATALPGGVTVSGTGAGRVFVVNPGKTATLRGLTITGGAVAGGNSGGAIFSAGTLTLTRCTLFGNSAGSGGAIYNGGNLTLTQCTLSGNSAVQTGGAINNGGDLMLTHCTLAGNSAGFSGGAIDTDEDDGSLTLNYSIVAGNTPNNLDGYPFTGAHNLTSGDPLLAPLGHYGGPTQTMALKPTSPALNAATDSPITADQRGFPIVGAPDIGAYEAGTIANYAVWNYETFPATATPAERAPGFDFDGDGRLNVLEYANMTDGTVPGSSVNLALVRAADGSDARLAFDLRLSATDLLYELQRSLPGVGPWVTIGDVNLRTNAIHNYGVGVTHTVNIIGIEFRDPGIAGQGKAFYRLQVSVP